MWDYPRPPRLEPERERVRIIFNGELLADSTRAFRVLETSHPPCYYLPPADIDMRLLAPADGRSYCEFKGIAQYWSLHVGADTVAAAAWSYPAPSAAFSALTNHLAFYASRVDECRVGDARVLAQPGDFYGGWITANLVGPFKGGPGTRGW